MSALAEPPTYSRIDVKPGHERRVLRGHPWVFSNELASSTIEFEPGQLVRVYASRERFLGVGYINPHSLIAVRLLRRTDGPVDEGFLAGRLDAALELRRRLYPQEEAVRLVFSEGDRLPGLVVDRYADHLAVQVTTAGMEKLFPAILSLLEKRLAPRCIVARNDVPIRRLEKLAEGVEVLHGEPDPDLTVTYEGLRLAVDLMGGQKTGLFLDQRDNQRALLPGLSRGEVLDCYCYQGTWGLLALRAGAERTTGVDTSSDGLDLAARHAEVNNLADRTQWVKGDVLGVLKEFRSRGRTFDMVILDPPAFVRSRKHVRAGLRGYLNLNRKALDVVAAGGVMITCSCSHHVRPEVFADTVAHAAGLASRHVRLLSRGGQSRDHPSQITAPETAYLKCLTLQIE